MLVKIFLNENFDSLLFFSIKYLLLIHNFDNFLIIKLLSS